MSKPTDNPPDYTIRLRPLKDPTDPHGTRRLRSLLKYALRACRLRCLSAVRSDGRQPDKK